MTVRLHRSPDPIDEADEDAIEASTFPSPEALIALAPFLRRLKGAAAEYDSYSDERTSASEFIFWLAFEVTRAAKHPMTTMHRELIRASSPSRRRVSGGSRGGSVRPRSRSRSTAGRSSEP